MNPFLNSHKLDAVWGQDWYICMYKGSFTAGLRKIYKYLLEEEKDKKSKDIGLLKEYFHFNYPKLQKAFLALSKSLNIPKNTWEAWMQSIPLCLHKG